MLNLTLWHCTWTSLLSWHFLTALFIMHVRWKQRRFVHYSFCSSVLQSAFRFWSKPHHVLGFKSSAVPGSAQVSQDYKDDIQLRKEQNCWFSFHLWSSAVYLFVFVPRPPPLPTLPRRFDCVRRQLHQQQHYCVIRFYWTWILNAVIIQEGRSLCINFNSRSKPPCGDNYVSYCASGFRVSCFSFQSVDGTNRNITANSDSDFINTPLIRHFYDLEKTRVPPGIGRIWRCWEFPHTAGRIARCMK